MDTYNIFIVYNFFAKIAKSIYMEFTAFNNFHLFFIESNIFEGEDHAIYVQGVGNLKFSNFSFSFNLVMDNSTSG